MRGAITFNLTYQLQKLSNKWRAVYNSNQPHNSLGNKSPKELSSTGSINISIKSTNSRFKGISDCYQPLT
ncbi:integrase core domain-containing protein [Myroides guanonis]|uniref:hypothetical protein n=1 Tax=Myroides guanonis TaxID=1150112 RepID=UPI00373FE24C